jgi:hypothetical protein
MLTLTLLAGLPWYCAVPAYFVVGALWALLYLPRSIHRQAQRYAAWRADLLQGKASLSEILTAETVRWSDGRTFHPQELLDLMRRYHPDLEFSERSIIRLFIANIAFWPWMMFFLFVTDLLRVLLRAVWRHFARLLSRIARMVWRIVKAVWRALRSFWSWLYSLVQGLYQAIIVRANREALDDLKKMKEARHDR